MNKSSFLIPCAVWCTEEARGEGSWDRSWVEREMLHRLLDPLPLFFTKSRLRSSSTLTQPLPTAARAQELFRLRLRINDGGIVLKVYFIEHFPSLEKPFYFWLFQFWYMFHQKINQKCWVRLIRFYCFNFVSFQVSVKKTWK